MLTKRLVTVLFLILGLMASMSPAWATPRTFPANTMRGTLTAAVFPQVVINGNTMNLAPGAKIFNQQNLVVLHSALVNQTVIVNYTVDTLGYVNRVWVLTNEELTAS